MILDDTALDTVFRTARSYYSYTDEPVGTRELQAIWDLMKFGPTGSSV
jgi:3-hydroxypropanoate dehydrogenase